MSVDIRYDGDQAAIQEGETPPIHERPCAWCMEPSVVERVIVKERKYEGEVVKPARLAPVCQEHSDMIDLNEEITSLWRRRGLWLRRWGHPDEEEQARVKAQLGHIERRLVKLGERIDRPRAADLDGDDEETPSGAAV